MRLYIDPAYGKPIAFSGWEDRKLICFGLMKTIREIREYVSSADCVYCEDQFPNISWESMKKLVRSAGWVEAVALLENKPFRLINPATWKKHYGLSKRKLTTHEVKEIKRNAVMEILEKNGIEILLINNDVQDAILIGDYVECALSAATLGESESRRKDTDVKNAGYT